MSKKYNYRRELLTKSLEKIQGISIVPPQRAIYAFPQLPEHSPNSLEFCERALDEVGLAIVPGIAFGENRCIRVSCATSSQVICEGIKRLNHFIQNMN